MIIDKYIPKFLGENLQFFSLSLKVINFITSLKCKHRPQSPEIEPRLTQLVEPETEKKKRKKRERGLIKHKLLKELTCPNSKSQTS